MRDITQDPQANRDAQTYKWAGWSLTAGMYASFAAMGVGLAWWLVTGAPGGGASASKVIPLDALVSELLALNPLALLNMGVLLLLATPGITLLTQIVTFGVDGNWRYVGITSLVGAVLLLSLALSMKWIKLF
jgi:uncharacterized membrane protein